MDWAVIHHIHVRVPNQHNAQLFVIDAPEDVTAAEVRSALTRAGRQYGEFGIPWANHYLAPRPEWPDEVLGAYEAGEVERLEWEKLAPIDQLVKMTIRLPKELYGQVAAAARERGQTITAFVVSLLTAAVAK